MVSVHGHPGKSPGKRKQYNAEHDGERLVFSNADDWCEEGLEVRSSMALAYEASRLNRPSWCAERQEKSCLSR